MSAEPAASPLGSRDLRHVLDIRPGKQHATMEM